MLERTATLAELREHLAAARGHAVLNGRPYLDDDQVLCHPCRLTLAEADRVAWTEHREGRRWYVTATHATCSPETPEASA